MTLVVSVVWLGPEESPRYHGAEWPPAPLRVFQALVAAAGRQRPDERERSFETLRGLATAGPPVIFAPRAMPVGEVASAVPNNDGDVIWAHRAGGRVRKAREAAADGRTIRRRHGRLVDGEVAYRWDVVAGTEDVSVLRRLADGVTHVGLGIDLANARVTAACGAEGGRAKYVPDSSAATLLQVPYPGVLDVLESRYWQERGRIGAHDSGKVAVSAASRVEHRTVGYASGECVRRNRAALFRLLAQEGKPHVEPGSRGMAVAAMMRHAIGEAGKAAGIGEAALAEAMGHGGEAGRIHALPVPNVGHRWADGGIRRVMVGAAPGLPDGVWEAVVRRLGGSVLTDGDSGRPVAVLESMDVRGDRVTRRYMGDAREWTTALPAVLPGHDQRRGKPRPSRAARRLLRFARIPEAAVEEVRFEAAAAVSGAGRAEDARVPSHLARYPRSHVTVRFRDRVTGPFWLGAGVGWGFGLLVACER